MGLLAKKWNESEINISDCFLFTKGTLNVFKGFYPDYIGAYCLEVDIINKIQDNEEGFFDFSKNMIDIGASIGEYPVCLDFKENYIFEPNKELMWVCHANLANAGKVYNSHTYEQALSASEGKAIITVNGIYDGDQPCTEFEVETKTLDSYGFKNVGFIKIDVETFEEKVIRGGLNTIVSNDYPPILFECWRGGYEYEMNGEHRVFTQEQHDSLYNLLTGLGYIILECWGDFETHLAVHKSHLK